MFGNERGIYFNFRNDLFGINGKRVATFPWYKHPDNLITLLCVVGIVRPGEDEDGNPRLVPDYNTLLETLS